MLVAVSESHLDLDWSGYAEEIGRRVAAIRRLRGVTQPDLAHTIGMSRSHLQNIERSRSSAEGSAGNPSAYGLARIACGLGVPMRLLVPQGVLTGEYRSGARDTWDQLEALLEPEVRRYPLPPETPTSKRAR